MWIAMEDGASPLSSSACYVSQNTITRQLTERFNFYDEASRD
jgi:hypothetical protein